MGNQKIKALNGRDIMEPPLQGFDRVIPADPGRCPGLAWFAPLVLGGSTFAKEHDTLQHISAGFGLGKMRVRCRIQDSALEVPAMLARLGRAEVVRFFNGHLGGKSEVCRFEKGCL